MRHRVQRDIFPRDLGDVRLAFDSKRGDVLIAYGDSNQSGANAAARFHQTHAVARFDRGCEQQRVDVHAIAACGLADAHAPTEQSVFRDLKRRHKTDATHSRDPGNPA